MIIRNIVSATNYPGNAEVCDGIDNNCDGLIDDEDPLIEAPVWYSDADGDGLGNANDSLFACAQPVGYTDLADDNCVDIYNPDQEDSDCDGVGDACDQCQGGDDMQDSDGDGIPDCADWDGFNELPACWKKGKNKVRICHIPPNKPWKAKTKWVKKKKVAGHLAHGDYLGPCFYVSCCGAGENSEDGLEMTTAEATMTIAPNPAREKIKLNWTLPVAETAGLSIQIITADGKLVKEWADARFDQNRMEMDVSDLASGIYFVKLVVNKDYVMVKQLIKMP